MRYIAALVVGVVLGAGPAFAAAMSVSSAKLAVFTDGVSVPTTTSAITFPAAGGTYNAAGFDAGCAAAGFCGTASASDGISKVEVSIRQSGGNYWNGTDFSNASEQLLLASGTASWTFGFPASNFPANGSYIVRALATATGGTTGSSSATFTIDTSAPTPTVAFPAASGIYNASTFTDGCGTTGTGDMCGSAADIGSSVANVKISVRRSSDGNYWNGTSFSSATEQLIAATGTTSWTFLFPPGNFPASGSYVIRAVATDDAGNAGADSKTFTFDVDNPTATITFPVAGAFYNKAGYEAGCSTVGGDFCGSAADVGSSVANVKVSLRRGAGNYWNGADFASSTEILLDAISAGSWSFTFAGTSFGADGPYTLRTVPTDAAGNTGSAAATFTIDNTPPATTDVQTANGTGLAGRAEQGDTITFSFSEQMNPASILTGWDGLSPATVTVTLTRGTGQGKDSFTVASTNLGTVNLGVTGYMAGGNNMTFGTTAAPTTMALNGSQIVITLGAPSSTQAATGPAATMAWTPLAGNTDRAGNPLPTTVRNETGSPADAEF
jgi:acid phosphatase family membrane protein YuiD